MQSREILPSKQSCRGIISNDQTLQWLQPGRNDRSRMEILVEWLGAGFVGCKARDVRAMIEQLKTPPLSPYLALYKDKVATIQNEDSPARSGARRKLPTSNTRKKQVRERECGSEVHDASADNCRVKSEPYIPDGSANALFVLHDDSDEDRKSTEVRSPPKELTIEEIHCRRALVDARLKYTGKRKLSEAEVDRLFLCLRFRQELLRRDVKGCTIGDIHSQIVDLIKGDRVLRWLQPASSGLSKMEILIGWLEENYAAYLRSNQKSALINGLRDKIATAGFPRCTARELREQISSLETPPWSPFLKLYSHRLDAIFHGVRVKREPDAATNEPRAARKTHQDINETRETQRNNKVTPRDSRDDSPIKIEPCFPDGSANAPLVVYSDGDENSREFSNEPTLEEIRRREALVDARLKYSENKRTLSQDELDMLFPMPKV
ncbi:hypothetical protein PC112_g6033 [Phytophthora cactorum]|nr:hypothetical protein PC112_g6033 [Phytophthora cactorum]